MKLLPRILFEKKYIDISGLALEMASPGNQHCASCIGTLSFPTRPVCMVTSEPSRLIQNASYNKPTTNRLVDSGSLETLD